MQQHDLLSLFVLPLEHSSFEYMVTGSVASTLYGEPRLTHDVDLVIVLDIAQVELFHSLFPLSEYYCPPPEVIQVELARKGYAHFNLIHHDSGYKADCYPFTGNALHEWGLKNRRPVRINSEEIQVAPPEYVIIRKLQFFREGGSQKHLVDIKKMVQMPDLVLDSAILQNWIKKLRLEEEWEEVQT